MAISNIEILLPEPILKIIECESDILAFKKEENLKIPSSIKYKNVGSLSNEVVEKLNHIKPPTIGAASRISGITPAAIIAILRHIKKNKKAA